MTRTEHVFRPGNKPSTPWGSADFATDYTEGVTFYTTPSHGGFHVSRARTAEMPAHLRNAAGWYEEDCEWAKVATAFPTLFTEKDLEAAERTLKNWCPNVWERHYGRKLLPGESYIRDNPLPRAWGGTAA